MLGYHPQVILAGRRINDGMGKYVAEQTIKHMIGSGLAVKDADIIVLGMTFKENCPDVRNSKVIDIIHELQSYGARVHVHDPLADAGECEHEYGVKLVPWEQLPGQACAVVAAVSHAEYVQMGLPKLTAKLKPGGVFSDVKSVYEPGQLAELGFNSWRL
jgi:UDP-N-acetyl-D-galactosamine dehydrogenase